MTLDFVTIFRSLSFLTESVRLQYTNFIFRHKDKVTGTLGFNHVVARLKDGEPIEYVFNLAEFYGNDFYVNRDTLIPRHETEEIVDRAVKISAKYSNESLTFIDVGTGSGCIALAIAGELRYDEMPVKVIGIDVSVEALIVAEMNKEDFGFKNVDFIHSSFQDFDFSKYENVIICVNLPYIPNSDVLQKSVIDYEPHLALFGGENGDELNNLLLEKLKGLPNIKAIYMEGYSGKITTIID